MSISRIASLSFGCLLLAAAPLCAAVKLPAILAEHMVLQQNRPVHLWGFADPGETVTATFRGQTASVVGSLLGLNGSLHRYRIDEDFAGFQPDWIRPIVL